MTKLNEYSGNLQGLFPTLGEKSLLLVKASLIKRTQKSKVKLTFEEKRPFVFHHNKSIPNSVVIAITAYGEALFDSDYDTLIS